MHNITSMQWVGGGRCLWSSPITFSTVYGQLTLLAQQKIINKALRIQRHLVIAIFGYHSDRTNHVGTSSRLRIIIKYIRHLFFSPEKELAKPARRASWCHGLNPHVLAPRRALRLRAACLRAESGKRDRQSIWPRRSSTQSWPTYLAVRGVQCQQVTLE
jgi:hypothetical protein